jgi:metal-responsive CopG/Arc/MetJ family transcriptional regulator
MTKPIDEKQAARIVELAETMHREFRRLVEDEPFVNRMTVLTVMAAKEYLAREQKSNVGHHRKVVARLMASESLAKGLLDAITALDDEQTSSVEK